ncbi:Rho termination factor N-terminal domain-containing protein [Salinarchaeum sp. IM2453]|uniref:Rho termination factor N-terminal domain-containing protein n=1 Tax=Salinarchaeum sp. IM2453 TaxID=2862870 RepID=UPI001C83C57D|nr:Rho termination factor N-terminal domain-containing protein [Salinarchaeum sp. IM2453]QZA87877.1 Rho termination factor N-terminal domain-containing protein [Salinarchaeum sp. IM2453]
MPSLDITEEQQDRIESLRKELEETHGGPYATVETSAAVDYLLDLAETADDPDRTADISAPAEDTGDTGKTTDRESSDTDIFSPEEIKESLKERNRRHTDQSEAENMDLYTIAAKYDVSGRSSMTKAELIDAILEKIEEVHEDPLAIVDVELESEPETKTENKDASRDADATTTSTGTEAGEPTDSGQVDQPDHPEETEESASPVAPDLTDAAEAVTSDSDAEAVSEPEEPDTDTTSGQSGGRLNAMLNLLEAHSDKWEKSDSDARYQVELPDGSTETARTKDDVRALLFQHYR